MPQQHTTKRILLLLTILISFIIVLSPSASAHSGGTDSQGGHYNQSTGEYHFHHGYPAHQHDNGVCPYDFEDRSESKSSSRTVNVQEEETQALHMASDKEIYVSGDYFHLSHCDYASGNVRCLASVAISNGFKPCNICISYVNASVYSKAKLLSQQQHNREIFAIVSRISVFLVCICIFLLRRFRRVNSRKKKPLNTESTSTMEQKQTLVQPTSLAVKQSVPQAPRQTHICPRCGNRMVIRNGRYGLFYGCRSYPNCRYTRNYP